MNQLRQWPLLENKEKVTKIPSRKKPFLSRYLPFLKCPSDKFGDHCCGLTGYIRLSVLWFVLI